ncbi:DUF1540 domain-containing protein [Ammoniphilus sp. CFH 90114]|uniref:DUF1540 domain-containing protein n=1 Tax=Ammoniphilus sp. CFH 90114 TaxID=2493665 RepID=UPI00100E1CC4|nr:DUF1540 domain-containing protein [Ammoniphilus sp. CFH 90114]RXT13519.1 DUF1540 domain-containing protein [Ammoniphilus sp. CFH 90114]
MPAVEVKCSVSNCTYWGQGNNCVAPAIMVEVDRHADYNTEMADEMGIQTEHKDRATNSAETCCRTFKQKQ